MGWEARARRTGTDRAITAVVELAIDTPPVQAQEPQLLSAVLKLEEFFDKLLQLLDGLAIEGSLDRGGNARARWRIPEGWPSIPPRLRRQERKRAA